MRILIDTRIAPKNITGMGYMMRNLIKRIPLYSSGNHYVFFGDFGYRSDRSLHIKLPHILKRALNFLWKTVGVPNLSWLFGRFDVALFPNYVDFPVVAKNKIMIIADVSFVRFPHFLEHKNLIFLRKYVPRAIQRASHVITISQTVKEELVQLMRVSPGRISVLPLAANESISPLDEDLARRIVFDQLGMDKKFILSFGTLEPRKNILAALSAYAALPSSVQDQYDFIVAGAKDRDWENIERFIVEHSLSSRVHTPGYIQDMQLVSALYSATSLFVITSQYEGFGMPILEALSCGAPVLANDIPVFRETFADIITYVPADSVDLTARAMQRLLESDFSEGRAQRMHFASQFSWDRSAQKLTDILRRVYEDSN